MKLDENVRKRALIGALLLFLMMAFLLSQANKGPHTPVQCGVGVIGSAGTGALIGAYSFPVMMPVGAAVGGVGLGMMAAADYCFN
ncbi:hypothetical protein [Macrococcus brunensis]|uniref:hypothetical protein n=1 Tax=Macrococcus brunensis TaxID=198483 RepID=UPI001EF09002|nr:hypothetical protein [Macrococcus brunensis]ULG73884.1 hypothetical protein MGG13_09520 [Macrococcus brunensis]